MEKNIYEMLNDVVINEDEYEKIELSEQDKAQKKQRILREVRAMETKERKRRRNDVKKAALATAAACVVVVGAVGAANPAMAEAVYSNTIGKLVENLQGTKDEEEAKIYQVIGENSVTAQEEADKHQDKSYNTTSDVNGVDVSISDVYCDGYVMYYTAVLKTDNESLNQAAFISAEKGGDTITVNGKEAGGINQAFEKASDGTFVKSGQIELIGFGAESDAESFADADSLEVAYTIENLTGYKDDEWDEQGEYRSTGTVDGEWKLTFPVTVDRSENETYAINQEENGVKLCDVVKTKAGLVLTVETPDFTKEPYNDPYNDPDIAVVDSNGNNLQWLTGGVSQENDDGTATYKIMVLYEGQTNLALEVTSRDEEQREIASIAFEIPQE